MAIPIDPAELHSYSPEKLLKLLIQEIKKLDPEIEELQMYYNGGNDSGGCEDVGSIQLKGGSYADTSKYDLNYSHIVWQLCDYLLSTKWGGWAFEGYTNGTLYVNVPRREAWTSGSIQVWENDEDPIAISLPPPPEPKPAVRYIEFKLGNADDILVGDRVRVIQNTMGHKIGEEAVVKSFSPGDKVEDINRRMNVLFDGDTEQHNLCKFRFVKLIPMDA